MMNEQIKELAEQAEEYTRLKYDNPYWHIPDDMKEDATWREKFAQLIVEECCTKMALEIMDHYVDDALKNTYEHFGVES